MKKTLFVLLIINNLIVFSQKINKFDTEIKAGNYLINTTDLYFFDVGINCYLKNICNDIDSVFQINSENLYIKKDTIVKVISIVFTDNYEYLYIKHKKDYGWLRAPSMLSEREKNFLRIFLQSPHYDIFTCYVQVIPFKNKQRLFLSTTDDWYICDLETFKTTKIGTKGGRVQDCQMVYSKDCVKCIITMGWEEEIYYNSEGVKIK